MGTGQHWVVGILKQETVIATERDQLKVGKRSFEEKGRTWIPAGGEERQDETLGKMGRDGAIWGGGGDRAGSAPQLFFHFRARPVSASMRVAFLRHSPVASPLFFFPSFLFHFIFFSSARNLPLRLSSFFL